MRHDILLNKVIITNAIKSSCYKVVKRRHQGKQEKTYRQQHKKIDIYVFNEKFVHLN